MMFLEILADSPQRFEKQQLNKEEKAMRTSLIFPLNKSADFKEILTDQAINRDIAFYSNLFKALSTIMNAPRDYIYKTVVMLQTDQIENKYPINKNNRMSAHLQGEDILLIEIFTNCDLTIIVKQFMKHKVVFKFTDETRNTTPMKSVAIACLD